MGRYPNKHSFCVDHVTKKTYDDILRVYAARAKMGSTVYAAYIIETVCNNKELLNLIHGAIVGSRNKSGMGS